MNIPPSTLSESRVTAEPSAPVFFSCRRCRQQLFDESAVSHGATSRSSSELSDALPTLSSDVPRHTQLAVDAKKWRREKWVAASTVAGTGCTSVFLERAPTWAPCSDGNEGKLCCSKCKSKVGAYVWSGASCSCGEWITPSFQFQLARVDKKCTGNTLPAAMSRVTSDAEPTAVAPS